MNVRMSKTGRDKTILDDGVKTGETLLINGLTCEVVARNLATLATVKINNT